MHRIVPIALGQFGALLFGILGVRLLSHWVPPAVNGVYQTYFLTLTQLAVQITHPGLINFTSRYWHRERPQAATFIRFLWARSWANLRYLVPLLALIAAGLAIVEREPQWLWCGPVLLLANWMLALGAAATMALNADERNWTLCLINTVGAATRALLPLAGVAVFGATFLVLGVGFGLHSLLLGGGLIYVFRAAWRAPELAETSQRAWREELRDYGRPFVWLGIGGWLLAYADRWVVVTFFGQTQAGLFGLASSLGAYIPTLAMAGLMQGVFPAIFRLADAAKSRAHWQQLARRCDLITVIFLTLAIGGLAGLHLLAPHLVGWLIHPRYERSLAMVFVAGMTTLNAQANQFQYLLLQGQHNSAAMVRVMLAVAAVKTGGSVIAASVSWSAFSWWLVVSLPVSLWLGRYLIHRAALRSLVARPPGDI